MALAFLGLLGVLVCLALLAARAIRQEAPAREAVGLLLCAAVFVVGCVGLNRQETAPATIGIQALGSTANETTARLLAKAGLTRTQSDGGTTVTLEELCAIIEETVGKDGFTGVQAASDGSSITLEIWSDGLVQALADRYFAGGGVDDPDWMALKDALVEMADGLCALIDAAGYPEVHLSLLLENDLNTELALLSIWDTDIVYDVMADSWEM